MGDDGRGNGRSAPLGATVYPGGVGFASRLYDVHRELLEDAAALVHDCPCAAGCPSCVGPLHLVEGAKDACLRLLSASVLPV